MYVCVCVKHAVFIRGCLAWRANNRCVCSAPANVCVVPSGQSMFGVHQHRCVCGAHLFAVLLQCAQNHCVRGAPQ